ncbi:EF-hand domain-containing protein [Nonomuraea sp. NPDC050790]|uniref:EF-hand domain-containing protein n=1 Tax=Nonomuraea sp. NPDC050790 TaxID=3364371 RepID=UPI00379D6541
MDSDFLRRKVHSRLASFDLDRDGVITRADVEVVTGRALRAFGLPASSRLGRALDGAAASFWSGVAADAGGDADGEIRQEEYARAAPGFQKAAEPWVRALVTAADRDEDGRLSPQEYRSVLQALGADEETLKRLYYTQALVPVEQAQAVALRHFADAQPYRPATWAFGKF